MLNRKLALGLPLLLCTALLATTGPAWGNPEPVTTPVSAVQAADTISGKVLGVSKKAKTITLEGEKGPVMLKFDAATTGMEHAAAGEAAIITFRVEGKEKVAAAIKPKLATLPTGVLEITPADLVTLVSAAKGDYVLIDSRPAARYAEAHIPTAISIPVEKMGELAKTMLPQDQKDKVLVLYCGGVT